MIGRRRREPPAAEKAGGGLAPTPVRNWCPSPGSFDPWRGVEASEPEAARPSATIGGPTPAAPRSGETNARQRRFDLFFAFFLPAFLAFFLAAILSVLCWCPRGTKARRRRSGESPFVQ
jgi:hypothetical protein